jgi:PadR family transcriptional regulator PadR
MLCMIADSVAMGQLRRGVAEYCVLALLKTGEGYGFDLARTLSDAQIVASEGTIYPLLSRLRREGLVTTVWRQSALGPKRRYYVLTDAGSGVLERFIPTWQAFRDIVDGILHQ